MNDDFQLNNGVLTIKSGTQIIRSQAFFEREDILEVVLPESVEEIDMAAFGECYNLKHINFPERLKTIKEGAFLNCIRLKETNLPNGLREIRDMAFLGTGIVRISVPESVVYIGENAFWDCQNLISVEVLNPKAYIGANAFGYCYNLMEGFIAPGFPQEDESATSMLLYSLLWCSCPDKHSLSTTRRAKEFIQSHEELVMDQILKFNNIPAMSGIVSRQLLKNENIDGYVKKAIAYGLTEIAALLLTAKERARNIEEVGFVL